MKRSVKVRVDGDGCDVLTIGDLPSDGKLHPIEREFIEKGALRCARRIRGMMMAVKSLGNNFPILPKSRCVTSELAICRCGYQREILEAARSVSRLGG